MWFGVCLEQWVLVKLLQELSQLIALRTGALGADLRAVQVNPDLWRLGQP